MEWLKWVQPFSDPNNDYQCALCGDNGRNEVPVVAEQIDMDVYNITQIHTYLCGHHAEVLDTGRQFYTK